MVAIYVLWKISSNALHGIAKSNSQIAETQIKMVDCLQAIQNELKSHSDSDARIFTSIQESLEKQVEFLVRLEERTRSG